MGVDTNQISLSLIQISKFIFQSIIF